MERWLFGSVWADAAARVDHVKLISAFLLLAREVHVIGKAYKQGRDIRRLQEDQRQEQLIRQSDTRCLEILQPLYVGANEKAIQEVEKDNREYRHVLDERDKQQKAEENIQRLVKLFLVGLLLGFPTAALATWLRWNHEFYNLFDFFLFSKWVLLSGLGFGVLFVVVDWMMLGSRGGRNE